MSITEAMAEALAANPSGVAVIETLELDHITAAEPIYIVTNQVDDIDLPLIEGGPLKSFSAVGVEVTLPGVTEDGPTPMRIRMADPAGVMQPIIIDTLQGNDPISVTFRAYRSDDLTKPGDVRTGFFLYEIERVGGGWEATVSLKEMANQAFPRLTYSAEKYAGLQQI